MCLAIPGKIISLTGDDPLERTGRIDFSGIVKEINLAFVPEAAVGQYVLVHAGFAIALVDEAEAEETLRLLEQTLAPDSADEEDRT